MTIEEAQELVEVWSAKHPPETSTPDDQIASNATVLGSRFWELLDTANREGVDLTAALTETLAQRNTAKR